MELCDAMELKVEVHFLETLKPPPTSTLLVNTLKKDEKGFKTFQVFSKV